MRGKLTDFPVDDDSKKEIDKTEDSIDSGIGQCFARSFFKRNRGGFGGFLVFVDRHVIIIYYCDRFEK